MTSTCRPPDEIIKVRYPKEFEINEPCQNLTQTTGAPQVGRSYKGTEPVPGGEWSVYTYHFLISKTYLIWHTILCGVFLFELLRILYGPMPIKSTKQFERWGLHFWLSDAKVIDYLINLTHLFCIVFIVKRILCQDCVRRQLLLLDVFMQWRLPEKSPGSPLWQK